MTWRALLVSAVLLVACGDASDGNSRSATGGSGGSPSPSPSYDQTCRDWCANEWDGESCHQGPFETVQPCYESCLQAYQQELDRECGDEWIAIKDCEIGLECHDLFGDCDPIEDAFDQCATDDLCTRVCGWPDDCFAEFGVEGATCRQDCEETIDRVGMDCLQAIHEGVECLGTCNPDAMTEEDVLRCEAAAQAIDSACE